MGIFLLTRFLTILCVFIVFLRTILCVNECPVKCTCKRTNQADTAEWVKVRCGDFKKIQTFEELDFNNIASEVVQLNLSNNSLNGFQPKIQFVALQKLDISGNQLVDLVDKQFVEVPNLKRLDISSNQIKNVGKYAFENLRLLERLKLNNNFISTIEKGTFDYLENLKQLDISNNPLTCDCKLLWLLKWAENTSVKLMSNPKCASPAANKGISIKKLKIGEHVHCKSPAQGNREIPIVEITPNHSQIVFEGDSLRLNCKAPSSLESYDIRLTDFKDNIEWSWLDSNPRSIFNDVLIENKYLEDVGLIDSSLIITKLNRNHTGTWNCELISNKHRSKSVRIIVISNETKFCSSVLTSDNKGVYIWPKTIVNNTVYLPCKQTHLSIDINLQKASYFCSENGNWIDLNTTTCSYISDTTRILEQFSKFSLAMGKGGLIDSAKHFKNYISDLNQLKDIEDLIFTIRTIESYAQFVTEEKELSEILIEITSTVLNLNETFIQEACLIDNSCNKLIQAIENVARSSSSLQKSNIALEMFPVKQTTFSGMTCTWYITRNNLRERLFYCATTNQIAKSVTQEKTVEASVQVPTLFFHQLRNREVLQESLSHKILISMFGDGKLFPIRSQTETIVSAVVGIKLDDEYQIENLTEPINVMLRTPKSSQTSPSSSELIPVWWNKNLNNGTGSWTTNGCYFVEEIVDCTVFKCHNLGYYALKQNVTQTSSIKYFAKFKFSHSAIYIGSFILFMCLLTSILTYLFFYAAIQMPRKAKHSLLNIWISIAILCFIYVFGIYQTEDLKLCQIIGLILHYLTLSSLLWMCVGVNGMYKRLRKNDNRVLELQDDEIEEHIKKPIIGLYFVGWGIALIVCGISSAVNMKEYSSINYCFLSSEPALSALYVPFTILIITLCIYFSLIRCSMYSIDTGGHLSEGTQATENVDLDLLEPNFPNNSIPSISTKSSSETEDPEHAPIVQLKAYIIFLFIYVLTWISCALSTVQPLKLKKFEEVFCVAYAILAIILGSFTVFFYCIARNDVRTRYVLFTKNLKKRRFLCFFIRSRNVSDNSRNTVIIPQIQVQPLPPIPIIEESDDINTNININRNLNLNQNQTRSSSRSSSNNTNTKSNNSNRINLKGADLNSYSDSQGIKINNVNLVVLHRKQYRGNAVVPNLIENPTNSEMFYNPHQITVARKFFRKQKRNMMKHTNLVTKRNEFLDNSSSISSFPVPIKTNNDHNQSVDHQSIFSTNSKVNNTNIHIEKVRKHRITNNPNILLMDSYEDEAIKNGDFKDKKRKHKKKQNVVNYNKPSHDNMRSVSQQCTLEYSSEAISDSILDQKSPEKINFNTNFNKSLLETAATLNFTNPIESNSKQQPNSMENINKNIDRDDFEGNSFLPGRIYVNPSHEPLFPINKRVQSRASSVSASEIDELYQEIRGPRPRHNKYDRMRQPSPCYSDSEVTSGVSEVRFRNRRGFFGDFRGSGKISSSNV